MSSRKYLVGALVVALLIWGPLDHAWPAWFAIRMGYLIAIPVAAWFLLGWIWRVWQPDAASENRFERALGGATAGVLVVLAILEAMANTHVGNTMYVRTREGTEAVGDDIVMRGPDWGNVFMLLIAAGFALWFSVAKRESKQ
ncbi:MAG: hypothetical protein Q8O22_08300 [Candidatus Omnitrophota bacterium]|nr:hypothetical protein [Candidatus Omnitrophota bacterium]